MATRQETISTSKNIFSVLSREDSLRMFIIAKDGLKISPSIIDKLEITPKAYYKALKQLRDAGLIEKKKSKEQGIIYFHTTFGSIVYQRNIIEMEQYMKNLEKMQMIDIIRQAEKFSEADILMLTQEIIHSVVKSSSSSSNSSPFATFKTINNVDIVLLFDNVIQTLIDRISCCKNEIVIATRICPEIVINKILEKSKLGIKVKVIADIDLVKEYFKSQEKFAANLDEKNPKKEREGVIANPWYPDSTISRRISDIPFGVIILDSNEVGIELVNSNNPNEFYGAVFIKDEKIAMTMTEFYSQIWEKASENLDVTK